MPLWSNIADRFEYDPELFAKTELLQTLEHEAGDDPSVYEWDDKVRNNLMPNARFHPKFPNY